MKIRIRSSATKETVRIEVPESLSLIDLKGQVARIISPAVSPDSVRLSLNLADELVPPSPSASLRSLGLTSGDLLHFSLIPHPPTPNPAVFMGVQESEVSATHTPNPTQESDKISTHGAGPPRESMEIATDFGDPCQCGTAMESGPVQQKSDGDASVSMDFEMAAPAAGSKFSSFLKGIMEAEMPLADCGAKFLLIAVHAVFLDSGFMVVHENGKVGGVSRLPEGWEDKESSSLSLVYTLKNLANEELANVVVLKLSVVANLLMVYANVGSYIHHVSLNMEMYVPAVISPLGVMSEREEKEVYQFWKLVKDQLCFPLTIDFCEKNGLVPPPCFIQLPSELKMMILDLLPAVDITRIASTCTELRRLSLKDELWIKKFEMEFGSLTEGEMSSSGSTWRMRFKKYWLQSKNNRRILKEGFPLFRLRTHRHMMTARHTNPLHPEMLIFPSARALYHGYPAAAGGHPAGGSLGSARFRSGCPSRTNLSPECNFGGRHFCG